jgi:steroid Delta-isomerase
MAISPASTQEEKNAHYRAVLNTYVEAVSRKDPEAVLALYSIDAELEDPVGSGRCLRGKESLRPFYERVCRRNLRMTINGHISGAKSNVAAAPIRVEVGPTKMSAISVAWFNDEGLITRYHAFWGPGDIEGPDPTEGQPVP